ncbi:hypothetical protein LINPERHAP2_LOCUS24454, partial [Linum perenne]
SAKHQKGKAFFLLHHLARSLSAHTHRVRLSFLFLSLPPRFLLHDTFASMAALAVAFASSYLSNLIPNTTAVPISYYFNKTQPQQPMLLFFFFFFAFTLSFTFSLFFLCRTLRRQQRRDEDHDPAVKSDSLSKLIDGVREIETSHLPHSLLLEILPSDSPKWDDTEASSAAGDSQRLKKKKRRAKKKRLASKIDENGGAGEEVRDSGLCGMKPELVCLYPFTSASSATQRKIKQQYDQLVKCNEKKGLTLAQVPSLSFSYSPIISPPDVKFKVFDYCFGFTCTPVCCLAILPIKDLEFNMDEPFLCQFFVFTSTPFPNLLATTKDY